MATIQWLRIFNLGGRRSERKLELLWDRKTSYSCEWGEKDILLLLWFHDVLVFFFFFVYAQTCYRMVLFGLGSIMIMVWPHLILKFCEIVYVYREHCGLLPAVSCQNLHLVFNTETSCLCCPVSLASRWTIFIRFLLILSISFFFFLKIQSYILISPFLNKK